MMLITTPILTSVLWMLVLSSYGNCELIVDNPLIICLDCIDIPQSNICNIPFCAARSECANNIDVNNFTTYETNDLKLICRDDNSLTFKWRRPTEKIYHFMEYVEEGSNKTEFTNLTQCNIQTINKLIPKQKYEIQPYSFSIESKILFKGQKIQGYTTKVLAPRTPVVQLNYNLTLENEAYTATVAWKPGAGNLKPATHDAILDLSCLYEIIWYRKNSQSGNYNQRRINLKKQPSPEFNLTNLDFGKKYGVSIRSIEKIGEKESPLKSINIAVPSCLDSYKNLSICAPDTPKNLTIIEYSNNETDANITDGFSNLKLSWNRPIFQPYYYIAKLISKMDISSENITTTILNISGVDNYTIFKNIKLGIYNRIMLTAYSDGGSSNPIYIHVSQQNDSKSSSLSYQESSASYFKSAWIWIGFISGSLTVILTLVFRLNIKNILFKYLDIQQGIDDTIVKYIVNDTEDLKWELNEAKLTLSKVIGHGAFGVVQIGWYLEEPNIKSEVAVKTLRASPSEEQITQFYNEIEIMKSVPHHPHIVYLIGVITKNRPNNPLMLVEHCANGDLQTFLRNIWLVLGDGSGPKNYKCNGATASADNCTKSYDMGEASLLKKEYVLQSKDLLSFARQIVVGMEFLCNLKMIHRDLAARNILLTENYTIKISDFGLCRDIYTNNVYQKVTGGKLPFRWMALESLTHQIYTTESDVWSFGIVLWEIVTLGGNPFPTIKTENLIHLLKGNYRMENPINCSEELYHIMLRCWEARPGDRPTFTELHQIFDKLLESEMQYISLEDARKLDLIYYENIRNTSIGLSLSNRYIVQANNFF